jgi:Domain of unknown function (DUF305)
MYVFVRYPILTGTLLLGAASVPAARGQDCPALLSAYSCAGAGQSQLVDETAYLAENDAAMTKMMGGMSIRPSGDVDQDFAAMMIPHHQGAIEMAQAELRHGRNEKLRRIAQEIIVEQQQEIAAMRLALDQPLPPSIASPDQPADLSAPVRRSNIQKEP